MELSKNNYFYQRKQQNSREYQLLVEVEKYSNNSSDFVRRLKRLDLDDRCERQLQGGNFVSELKAFKHYGDEGLKPCWISESSIKSPDFYVINKGYPIVVEVKTLNLPIDEGNFLRTGSNLSIHEIAITEPEVAFEKKIKDGCDDAMEKFECFWRVHLNDNHGGVIWFSYVPSLTIRLQDGAIPEIIEKIKATAEKLVPETIKIYVANAWPDAE